MIKGATILYMSATDWTYAWHGPQELALRMARAGNRVVYVEPLGWRRPRLFDAGRIAGRVRRALSRSARTPAAAPDPNLRIVSPLLIPGARSRAGTAVNRRLLLRQIVSHLGDRGDGPLVLWQYTPTRLAADLVGAFGEDLALYHCTQGHAHRPFAPPDTALVERELMERSAMVVVDGIRLFEERAPLHPHVYRVPSGVNPGSHLDAELPDWMRALPRPVLGYMGSVDHRLDIDLLMETAMAFPQGSLVVVGPVTDVNVSALGALPNVHLTGHVPVDEVPGALTGFDVGLMPYADQPMTPYTYPAKLHQYLAAGLPIASTPLPDLADFPGMAEQGDRGDGFIDAVRRALASDVEPADRRAVAAANTWEARAEAMSALLEAGLAGAPPASSADFRPEVRR